MTEKFRVNRAFRDGAAVYGKVFATLAEAVLVNDLRNILLADTAFTGDQDSKVCRGDGHGRLQCSVKGGIIADDVVFVFKSLQFL